MNPPAVLIAAGLFLFAWTMRTVGWRRALGLATEPRHPEDPRLALAGPFAVVRRPMALAAILVLSGVAFAAGTAPVLAVAALAIGAIVFAVARSEAVLVERHGEAYRRYQKAVPLLLPRLRARRNA